MRNRSSRTHLTLRLVVWTLGIFAMVTACLLAFLILPCLQDPAPRFEARRGRLAEIRETGRRMLGRTELTELTLVSSSGLEVEMTVRVPVDVDSKAPLILLLGGYRTGRDAARLVVDTKGVVVAALSYPYRGDPTLQGPARLAHVPKIQQAILDTPPAVLLALDYLLERSYVDRQRVELVGVSLGAFFVAVPGALDTRIRRVWLIHGAGSPAEVLAHRLENDLSFGPARRFAGRILALLSFSRYLAPERWVGRIAPRPVIVVNARDDETLTASSVESLHRALRQPSEILWTEGPHVLPNRRAAIERITALVLDRLEHELP